MISILLKNSDLESGFPYFSQIEKLLIYTPGALQFPEKLPFISVEFPEFSNQEVCNPLMFPDCFESLDETLVSLRSLALAVTLAGLTGESKEG
ncbi:MAG: hypothetical protein GTO12_20330 [Proteobacteria bacterium]|nr:hypothetical protein [Pseudomonadota bacterium]